MSDFKIQHPHPVEGYHSDANKIIKRLTPAVLGIANLKEKYIVRAAYQAMAIDELRENPV